VVLVAFVCLLASAVAISLFHCAQAAKGRSRLIWLSLDAVTAGIGIWATHFIAMLTYDPTAPAPANPIKASHRGKCIAVDGTWSFDDATKLYTITLNGEIATYSIAEPSQGLCMLVKGDLGAADLRASWNLITWVLRRVANGDSVAGGKFQSDQALRR
jgi:hypothetical protein